MILQVGNLVQSLIVNLASDVVFAGIFVTIWRLQTEPRRRAKLVICNTVALPTAGAARELEILNITGRDITDVRYGYIAFLNDQLVKDLERPIKLDGRNALLHEERARVPMGNLMTTYREAYVSWSDGKRRWLRNVNLDRGPADGPLRRLKG